MCAEHASLGLGPLYIGEILRVLQQQELGSNIRLKARRAFQWLIRSWAEIRGQHLYARRRNETTSKYCHERQTDTERDMSFSFLAKCFCLIRDLVSSGVRTDASGAEPTPQPLPPHLLPP